MSRQQNQSKGRYEEVVSRALEAYGLAGCRWTLLQDLVNTSFRVERNHKSWYLRVYRAGRHQRIAIESELMLLDALAADGCAVPKPLRTPQNELVCDVSSGTEGQTQHIGTFEWLEGSPLKDGRISDHYYNIGGVLASVHNSADKWTPSLRFTRPRVDSIGLLDEGGQFNQSAAAGWKNVSGQLRTDLNATKLWAEKMESRIGRNNGKYGLIHVDPSFGNILFHETKASLIDFDDCGYGFRAYDLAVVLSGAWESETMNRTEKRYCWDTELDESLSRLKRMLCQHSWYYGRRR